ncbi:hypothetical protein PRZ48_012426 [Zasmidium cellare]|uniref:Heterokaryon incompatibility domain-containing protein n=1 Tax=Zasmidium cellare TaxID=395010 RepID=A0ABR0E5E0_ZASCE|nr:hypothetical protein PRZ48_012426 [Zasmidium cellare]
MLRFLQHKKPLTAGCKTPSRAIYEPLDEKELETRFMTNLSTQQYQGVDTISISLSKASFRQTPTPTYVALSYCWGDPNDTVPVLVNGQPFHITRNLEAALRQFRSKDSRLLWADAICINQDDSNERSHQVSRMGDIFSQASQVICWLGLATTESSRAIEHCIDVDWQALTLEIEERGLEVSVRDSFVPLDGILRRPYWSRVWVVQEIANATSIEIWCGRDVLSWDQFLSMIYCRSGCSRDVNYEAACVRILDSFRRQQQSHRLHLWEAMLLTFDRSATDPRDKAYALLSLVSDAEEVVHNPDYTSPAPEVLKDIAWHMIVQQGQTPLMLLGGRRQGETKGPSWVPSWELTSQRAPVWVIKSCHDGLMPIDHLNPIQSNELQVRGRIVGYLLSDGVLQPPPNNLSPTAIPTPTSQQDIWSDLAMALYTAYHEGLHLGSAWDGEAEMLALALALKHAHPMEQRTLYKNIYNWYESFKRHLIHGTPFHVLVEAVPTWSLESIFGARQQHHSQFLHMVNAVLGQMLETGMKFVSMRSVSTGEERVRVAAAGARGGDVVVDLEGCRWAYGMLSPVVEGKYEVVGSLAKGSVRQEKGWEGGVWETFMVV